MRWNVMLSALGSAKTQVINYVFGLFGLPSFHTKAKVAYTALYNKLYLIYSSCRIL